MSKKPRLGFIGVGMMGQIAHLANYARLRDANECEIIGITDLKPLLARAVAEKYNIPRIYADATELLRDPAIDAVVCIQQWPNNYGLVKQILQAKKSVITEKPMVGRLDEAQELAALAHDNGVLYAVGFMKRYDTGVEMAKQLFKGVQYSGELGDLVAVEALCDGGDWIQNAGSSIAVDDPTPLPPLQPTYPDSCTTPAQRAAYGYLVNIFAHNINLCHHFLEAEMSVYAAQFRGSRGMQALLRSGNVLVTVHGTTSASHEWREYTTFTFERGQLVVKTPVPLNRQQSATVYLTRPAERGFVTNEYHAPVDWAFFREAQGFIDALAGKAPLRAAVETCLWDVRVMERIIDVAEVI
ncbi:MAG TPA: Gfo/Idh/MocA family oxidoreductase [Ktedonobacteraceae bacterium]|nr:Gfo/Idh/MocA family oxidoreductase [Ktedonobacteraceae bacterium]